MMMWSPSLQSWGNMGVAHQEVIVAKTSDAVFFFAGTIDRDAFAEGVVVADFDTGVAALVAEILWLCADDNVWVQDVVVTDRHVAHERNIVEKARTAADFCACSDSAKGTDFYVLVNFGSGIDPGVCCYAGCHVLLSLGHRRVRKPNFFLS